jgi:hypothetical protein
MIKYLKSFIYENKKENYTWISGLIIFKDNNKFVLDKGFIITNDISNYSFYCQFNNFTIINGELHYAYPEGFKKINPKDVYLHIRIGNSPFSPTLDNLSYWNLYFTSPNNKVYKSIQINPNKIKIIGGNHQNDKNDRNDKNDKNKLDIKDVKNPFFYSKEIYNDSSVLFSSLDIFNLE